MSKQSSNVEVRYVPAICGSPGWMSVQQAEREFEREMHTIELLEQCGCVIPERPQIQRPEKKIGRKR